LIVPGQGKDEAIAKMLDTLLVHNVECYRLDRERYVIINASRPEVPTEAPVGSYVIFLNQPTRSLIKALFERQSYPSSGYRLNNSEPDGNGSGWTLPLLMGVEALPVKRFLETHGPATATRIKDGMDVRRDLGLPLNEGLFSSKVTKSATRL